VILVVTYSRESRQTLRNACQSHEDAVVRRFGRAALFEDSELGAFLALRFRAKHGADVQIERTRPLNEFAAVPESVRDAAAAYEGREHPSTPYAKFRAGTEYPSVAAMRERDLAE